MNGSLIQTGIKGLDTIFMGGIPRENVILIEGEAGAGKSLLGTEFIMVAAENHVPLGRG